MPLVKHPTDMQTGYLSRPKRKPGQKVLFSPQWLSHNTQEIRLFMENLPVFKFKNVSNIVKNVQNFKVNKYINLPNNLKIF